MVNGFESIQFLDVQIFRGGRWRWCVGMAIVEKGHCVSDCGPPTRKCSMGGSIEPRGWCFDFDGIDFDMGFERSWWIWWNWVLEVDLAELSLRVWRVALR